MPRLRFRDFLTSRGPTAIGSCGSDRATCAEAVNAAQERLIYAREAGDAGWFGSWAEMSFNVSQDFPNIYTPREVSRLESIDLCNLPIRTNNQFFEYLTYGNGRMPKSTCPGQVLCGGVQAYDRGIVDLSSELPENTASTLRIYLTTGADVGKRVFISGLDINSAPVNTLDGPQPVQGEFVVLEDPFADSTYQYTKVSGIQKDTTIGPVSFYAIPNNDPGSQSLVLMMQPNELVTGYRKYYLSNLPAGCCGQGSTTTNVAVTALAKLQFIPVETDTDWLLIQSMEALIAECQSIRYSTIDGVDAKQQAQERHTHAIRLLQGQLVDRYGKLKPAVDFAPFGYDRLEYQKIGSLM